MSAQKDVKKNASETGQVDLLEEWGSKARVPRIEARHMALLQENWSWKESGCRKNSSTLVGQMKVNAKHVTRRKAQKSAGFTIAPSMVRDQKGDPRGLQKVGAKSENFKERVEVVKRYTNASPW